MNKISKESYLLSRLDEYDSIIKELEGWVDLYKDTATRRYDAIVLVEKVEKVLLEAIKDRDKARLEWNDFINKERTPI